MQAEKTNIPLFNPTYKHQEYSQSFHTMMNRVVTRIYLRKGKRKVIKPGIVCPLFNEEDEEKKIPIIGAFSNKNKSLNRTAYKFFNTPRNTKVENNPLSKFEIKLQNSACQGRGVRCTTDPFSSFKVKLTQKLEQNNRCLKIKSFKNQEKNHIESGRSSQMSHMPKTKHETCSFRELRNKKDRLRRTERCNTLKDYDHKSIRSTSLPITFNEDFKPWQTQEGEEVGFF